jgi:histidinol-phosphate aminotransferase
MPENPVALLRPEIARLKGYQATPHADAEAKPLREVRLDSNENPYGSIPPVSEALANANIWHRYPDPTYADARQALSKYCGAPMDRIVLGNGSDELIDLIVRAFVSPGDRVVISPPTFDMYQIYTEIMGGEVVEVPRKTGFELDCDGLIGRIDSRTKVVFVASPNSPTGNPAHPQDLARLAVACPLLVVDEAYAEFGGQNSVPMALECENVIVLRSLSKWAGLAGLRIGYGVFPSAITPYVNSLRSPYNVNQAAQLAVQVTLANLDQARESIARQVKERERLMDALSCFAFLHPYPSQTNFIFTEVLGRDARALQASLARQGVIVRCYSQPSLQRYLRIGVGTPEDNEALLALLRDC